MDTISEEDFKNQVEIIGWLYQYYISERKNKVIKINKRKLNIMMKIFLQKILNF